MKISQVKVVNTMQQTTAVVSVFKVLNNLSFEKNLFLVCSGLGSKPRIFFSLISNIVPLSESSPPLSKILDILALPCVF
jgi:hypothetical protein